MVCPAASRVKTGVRGSLRPGAWVGRQADVWNGDASLYRRQRPLTERQSWGRSTPVVERIPARLDVRARARGARAAALDRRARHAPTHGADAARRRLQLARDPAAARRDRHLGQPPRHRGPPGAQARRGRRGGGAGGGGTGSRCDGSHTQTADPVREASARDRFWTRGVVPSERCCQNPPRTRDRAKQECAASARYDRCSAGVHLSAGHFTPASGPRTDRHTYRRHVLPSGAPPASAFHRPLLHAPIGGDGRG
jgi:hypothetical protein